MEGEMAAASDAYFDARPHLDSKACRLTFDAGFQKGWNRAQAQPTADDQLKPGWIWLPVEIAVPKGFKRSEIGIMYHHWDDSKPSRMRSGALEWRIADDQARRDAERLDWLETAQQTVYRYEEQVRLPKTDGSNEYEIRLEFRGWCVTGNDGEYFATPREAIDAAQAASAAEGSSDASQPG